MQVLQTEALRRNCMYNAFISKSSYFWLNSYSYGVCITLLPSSLPYFSSMILNYFSVLYLFLKLIMLEYWPHSYFITPTVTFLHLHFDKFHFAPPFKQHFLLLSLLYTTILYSYLNDMTKVGFHALSQDIANN